MASNCHVDFQMCIVLPLPCIVQLSSHMSSFAYHVTALPSPTTPTNHQMQMREYHSTLPMSSPHHHRYTTQELVQIVQKMTSLAPLPAKDSKLDNLHLTRQLIHSSLQSVVSYLNGGPFSAQVGHTLSCVTSNAVPNTWLVGLHHNDITACQEMTLVDFLAWLRTSQAKM